MRREFIHFLGPSDLNNEVKREILFWLLKKNRIRSEKRVARLQGKDEGMRKKERIRKKREDPEKKR